MQPQPPPPLPEKAVDQPPEIPTKPEGKRPGTGRQLPPNPAELAAAAAAANVKVFTVPSETAGKPVASSFSSTSIAIKPPLAANAFYATQTLNRKREERGGSAGGGGGRPHGAFASAADTSCNTLGRRAPLKSDQMKSASNEGVKVVGGGLSQSAALAAVGNRWDREWSRQEQEITKRVAVLKQRKISAILKVSKVKHYVNAFQF